MKNIHAVELGKLGGKKGGKARAKKLTKEQRSDIARKAANARWEKYRRNRPKCGMVRSVEARSGPVC